MQRCVNTYRCPRGAVERAPSRARQQRPIRCTSDPPAAVTRARRARAPRPMSCTHPPAFFCNPSAAMLVDTDRCRIWAAGQPRDQASPISENGASPSSSDPCPPVLYLLPDKHLLIMSLSNKNSGLYMPAHFIRPATGGQAYENTGRVSCERRRPRTPKGELVLLTAQKAMPCLPSGALQLGMRL